MSAVGKGESAPIASNDTEAGKQANRRIEFNLTKAP
jgi:outer membrane protein OmpA-like peptidoglycan-associated protein